MTLLLEGQPHESSIDLLSLLAGKQELVIGRHESCCLRLDHITISRKHATLSLSPSSGEWSFTCKGSTHHSFINDSEVAKSSCRVLRDGDVITFGKSPQKYIFSASSSSAGTSSVIIGNAASNMTTSEGEEGGNTREDRLREIALMTASLKAPPSAPSTHSMDIKEAAVADANGNHNDNGNDIEMDTASLAQTYKVPITSTISLKGHIKMITSLHTDPSGARVLTGAADGSIKIYDFGGMDSRHNAFQSFYPEQGMSVSCVRYNCQGDRFLISNGNNQPILYDRGGTKLFQFMRGDMYIRDLSKTKGHIMAVNDICWHPNDKNSVMTASADGSIRLWDITDDLYLDMLKCKKVYKMRTTSNNTTERINVTRVAYSKEGRFVVGGTSDGMLHVFGVDSPTRPRAVINTMSNSTITSIVMVNGSKQGYCVIRTSSGVVAVYDFAKMLQGTESKQALVMQWDGLISRLASNNVCVNGEESMLCLTTCEHDGNGNKEKRETGKEKGEGEQVSHLVFIRLKEALTHASSKESSDLQQYVLRIALPPDTTPHRTWWTPVTNQIFIATHSGQVQVYFDNSLSTKGALLSATRAPSKLKVESFSQSIGKIYNPHALPMYRDESMAGTNMGGKGKKRSNEGGGGDGNERKKASVLSRPSQPKAKGASSTAAYTEYVAKSMDRARDIRSEDPREALLRVEEAMRLEGSGNRFTKAYDVTQPDRMLAEKTLDEEKEELRNKKND